MKICIVNYLPPSLNPRTRKEADSLSAAGHDVTVVSASYSTEIDRADATPGRLRRWKHRTVNYRRDTVPGFIRSALSGGRIAVHRVLARAWVRHGVAERAFARFDEGFLPVLLAERADLYLAHNLPSLPVAARAARRRGAMLGFDIEDYHLDEDSDDTRAPLARKLKAHLMAKYLPRCDYLSAASEAMADAIVSALPVRRPVVLYNAFPLWEAAGTVAPSARPRAPHRCGRAHSAYWFSQVIGLDRGLQDFIRALPLLRARVEVHCRGRITERTRQALLALAESLGVATQMHFHAPVHFTKLVAEAAHFDFGLALEQPLNLNKQVTASNKLFVYLLAGLVPVVTDVPGQREVMRRAGDCGVLYTPGDIGGLARRINVLLDDPARLLAARQHAWEVARDRLCWDVEEKKLHAAIQALEPAPRRGLRHADVRPGTGRGPAPFDLPILMYHDIAGKADAQPAVYQIAMAALEHQLDLLAAGGYKVIGFPELFAILGGEDERTGREVVLTFDDGYESFATLAVPALVKRGMSATVFVVAGEVGGHNRWDDGQIAGQGRRLMNGDALQGVVAAGMRIGSHGWAHRDLTRSSATEVATEIGRSRQLLRERYGVEADVFSYPFGAHAPGHDSVLRAAGYRGAVTIFSGGRRVTANPFAMRRVYVHGGDDDLRFRLKLSAPYLRYRALRDRWPR